jgi:hypothetical protein
MYLYDIFPEINFGMRKITKNIDDFFHLGKPKTSVLYIIVKKVYPVGFKK